MADSLQSSDLQKRTLPGLQRSSLSIGSSVLGLSTFLQGLDRIWGGPRLNPQGIEKMTETGQWRKQ